MVPDIFMTRVDITMRIDVDFEVMCKQLRGKHFKISRDGYLSYHSPFITSDTQQMVFKFKPLTLGSNNYSVVFEGKISGVMNCLELAFEYYNPTPTMVRYDLFTSDYTAEKFEHIIQSDTSWISSINRVYKANGRFAASCLLMDDKVQFMTRKVKSLKDCSDFIYECYHLSDIFNPVESINLFNYTDLIELAI